MVNKKCERDVWSSGKNGENNAEKPRSQERRGLSAKEAEPPVTARAARFSHAAALPRINAPPA